MKQQRKSSEIGIKHDERKTMFAWVRVRYENDKLDFVLSNLNINQILGGIP
jgi:hypothetical protein